MKPTPLPHSFRLPLVLFAAILLIAGFSLHREPKVVPDLKTPLARSLAVSPAVGETASVVRRAPSLASLPPLSSLPPTTHPAIAAFRQWAMQAAVSVPSELSAKVPEGVRLAREHRIALKALIKTDPRTAIEQAVPMVLRQRLPAEIVAELEERVSARGPLEMYVATPLTPGGPPQIQHQVMIGDLVYVAQLYGRRAGLDVLPEITVNGVAVDRVLAVSESPLRALEVGEVPDSAKELVEFCPVSGIASPLTVEVAGTPAAVTEETPAAEVAGQVFYLCDVSHLEEFASEILTTEFASASGGNGGQVASRGAFPTLSGGSFSSGLRKWLYLRVIFPDNRNELQSEAAAYANVKALTEFYQQQSYGRLTFSGTVTPVLTLPHTEAWYLNEYNANVANTLQPLAMMIDAREAARAAGFTTEAYQNITLAYNSSLGNYLGVASSGGSLNWVKSTNLSTLQHEMGHNLGVHHSNTWNTTSGASVIGPGFNVEYGHPFDTMGGAAAGIANGHFNASMKDQLRWIPAENYHRVTQSGVYRLYQFDQPSLEPARRYSLKVAKDADRDYWLEFRQGMPSNPWWNNGTSLNWSPWGVDSGLAPSTAQGSNRGTQLLDVTPGSPDGLDDSALVIGKTFSDFEAGIHLTPIGKGGTSPESLDVVVNIGAFPGNNPPVLTLSTDNLAIAPGGTVNFTASASDADGDPLAYYWEFGDKLANFNGPSFSTNNLPTQSKVYASAGHYLVQCTVSDRKGGSVKKSLLVTVGAPSTFTLSGTVTDSVDPIGDVLVSNGFNGASKRWAYTNTDGSYNITNLASSSVTLSALKAGYSFAVSGFANPVTVGPSQSDKNFTATAGVRVSIAAVDASATETIGNTGTFRLTRTGSTASALTVYTNITGTAATSDYTLSPTANTSTTVPLELFTIPSGSATRDIVLTPKTDALIEGPETVVLSLVAGGSYLPSGPQTATMTIEDANTSLPLLDLIASVPETTEGSPVPAEFTVSRTGETAGELIVLYSIDATTGAATNGTDYTALSGSVVIPAGSATATINITALTDGLAEGMEVVKLSLVANAAAYVLPSNPPSDQLKINDADINIVSIQATDGSANENGDPGTFTFTRTGSTSGELLVNYSIGGDAIGGVDCQALSGFVRFAAGSSSATVEVIPFNDTQGEPTETVRLQLRSGVTYQVGTASSATVTIADDGDVPVVSVGATAQAVEGVTPTKGTFLITSTGTGAGNLSVRFTISGTAAANEIMVTKTVSGNPPTEVALNGVISVPRNGSATVNITPIDDALSEDAESVTLTLDADDAYVVDSPDSATLTVGDDDTQNMVSVSTSNAAASETVNGQFYFSRKTANANAITVRYAVGGTASPGVDYTTLTRTVVIAANQLGTFVSVVPLNDNLAEGMETVSVTILPDNLSTPTYGIEVGAATLNLADDDAGFNSQVGFANGSVVISEVVGNQMISVNRTGDTTGAASVDYAVTYGTAYGSGVDYLCPAGRMDFGPGETVKQIPFTVVDDALPEDTETVVLLLRNASGAAITSASSQFTVYLEDNEPIVTIESTDPFAHEAGDTAQFTVRRAGSTAGALVVPISVGGTASSGDFAALPLSVTIPNGSWSATFALVPLNNPEAEAVETVVVSLAASSNATYGPQTSATAFIADAQSNNPPFLQIVSPQTSTPFLPNGVGLSIAANVVDDGPVAITWSLVSGPGSAAFTTPNQGDTGVSFSTPGSYVLRLSAADGSQTTTQDLTVTVGAPSQPWVNTDIGSVAVPGSAMERNDLHALTYSGTNQSGNPISTYGFSATDSLFFRSRHLVGDGEIRARVRFASGFGSAPRVGVMFRESVAVGAPMATLVLAPFSNNFDLFHTRATANGSATVEVGQTVAAPYWLRLVRNGNDITAFDSPDGLTWTQRGTAKTIAMSKDILAGISVSAGSSTTSDTALVDNVQITGSPDNTAPAVNAGLDGNVLATIALPLSGTVSDDALPSYPGTTSTTWSVASGPGGAVFANASVLQTSVTFASAGTYVLRLTADDGEVRSYDETTVTVSNPTTPFLTWTQQQFGAGVTDPAIVAPDSDPDGDGVSNLLEYAFAMNPKTPSVTNLPQTITVPVSADTFVGVTYTRLKGATDLVFTPEFSGVPETAGFTASASVQINLLDNGDGTETVTLRDTTPVIESVPRFVRLRVKQN